MIKMYRNIWRKEIREALPLQIGSVQQNYPFGYGLLPPSNPLL
jgi:hypothetical protein